MKRLFLYLVSLAVLAGAVALFLGSTAPVAGKEEFSLTRKDGKTVPAVAYAPAGQDCHGVAIISHGAGGSEEGYAYLGTAMSDLGYMAVVVGHQESGRSAVRERRCGFDLRGGLAKLITDPS
ncbi:MAG: alpha/beta hydrolase, partial [Phycisphaerae bacterium]